MALEVDRASDLGPDLALVVAPYIRVDVKLDIEIGRAGMHRFWQVFLQKFPLSETIDSVGQWICETVNARCRVRDHGRRLMNPELPFTVEKRPVRQSLRLGSVLHAAGVSWETLTSPKFTVSAFQMVKKYHGPYDITFIPERRYLCGENDVYAQEVRPSNREYKDNGGRRL